jgi:hypothetical protein
MPAIVTLTFADMELLLRDIVTLQDLRLFNGIQDLGGDIIPAEDHACRFKYLQLGGYGARFFIGSAQLCWLVCIFLSLALYIYMYIRADQCAYLLGQLRPSAGYMKHLNLNLRIPAVS